MLHRKLTCLIRDRNNASSDTYRKSTIILNSNLESTKVPRKKVVLFVIQAKFFFLSQLRNIFSKKHMNLDMKIVILENHFFLDIFFTFRHI